MCYHSYANLINGCAKKEAGEEMKPEEKALIMKLIKSLGESIMKTKDDLQKMIHASTNKLSPAEVI